MLALLVRPVRRALRVLRPPLSHASSTTRAGHRARVGSLVTGAVGPLHAYGHGSPGGSVFCGEGGLGFDFYFGRRWHVTLELGFGAAPDAIVNDQGYGVSRTAGGGYVSHRPLMGFDVACHFSVRWGPEIQLVYYPEAAPNFHGVIEFASRLGSHDLELGVRPYIGADAVTVGAATNNPSWILAYGAHLVLRYVFP